jgi:hypothetical protein
MLSTTCNPSLSSCESRVKAEGKSGQSAFARTTDEAIQLATDQIVAKVVKLYTQSSI